MEELQSTEILEREILEDARKKAARILKNAEDTIRSKNAEWEKKTSELINDLEKKYSGQNKLTTEKLMARLPIDKLRVRVEKIEDLLHFAVESWYHKLNKKQILDLLNSELSERAAFYDEISSSTTKKAFYQALDQNEAETIINSINKNFTIEKASVAGYFPSITLETENVRIIASIQSIIDYYLLEKREELIEAMIGGVFTEGT